MCKPPTLYQPQGWRVSAAVTSWVKTRARGRISGHHFSGAVKHVRVHAKKRGKPKRNQSLPPLSCLEVFWLPPRLEFPLTRKDRAHVQAGPHFQAALKSGKALTCAVASPLGFEWTLCRHSIQEFRSATAKTSAVTGPSKIVHCKDI